MLRYQPAIPVIITPPHTGWLESLVNYSEMQLSQVYHPWLKHSMSERIYNPIGIELFRSAVRNTQQLHKAPAWFIVTPPNPKSEILIHLNSKT